MIKLIKVTLISVIFGSIGAIVGIAWDRLSISPTVVSNFHKMYYNNAHLTWNNTYWLGTPVQKCPLDLWIYQEMLHKIRPDLIIEAGTFKGGSAAFLASMCDLIGNGRVMTIDIEAREVPKHPRITYLIGSSTSAEILSRVKSEIKPGEKVMVILDSDHSKKHVLEELRLYSPLITKGSYLIVEDTNLGSNPVVPGFEGPAQAVAEFLANNKQFKPDPAREKFFMTFNPGGYLMRVE